MINGQKYIILLMITVVISGLIIKKLLNLIDVNISGIDYIIWFVYFIQMFIIRLFVKDFKVPIFYLFLFVITIVFIGFNYFYSKYIYSITTFFLGSFITIIFPLTYIISYSFKFEKKNIYRLVELFVISSTILLIALFIERVFNGALFSTEKISSVFIKTYGFIGTLSSLNIASSLFLYYENKNKKFLYIILFSFFMIAHLVMLKAFLSSMSVFIIYVFFFSKKNVLQKIVYVFISFVLLILILGTNKAIKLKIKKYKLYYLNTSGENLTPRLLLYREAINIAKDHFPFGSGQGTYGSFPVMKNYNDVYIDYGLSQKQGLMFKGKQNFLFDSHWSSIIGEMGFFGAFIYILLFLYPGYSSLKYMRHKDLKPFVFLIIALITVIFVESLALAIPYQISFIIIYAGFTGIIHRYLRNYIRKSI